MDAPTTAEIDGFLALLEEGSVSAAAQRLRISQPAMSASLARLRRRFGDPLLVRSGRGMVPTPRAEALLPAMQGLREAIVALSAPLAAFDPGRATGTLAIAASDYSQRVLLAHLVVELTRKAPGVALEIRTLDWENLRAQLDRRRIDFAIVPRVDAWPELMSRALFEESFVCAMRADHPLTALTLDSYCAARHLSVVPGARPLAGAVDEGLAALGRERQIALKVTSFLVVPDILTSTDWLATIPARLARSFAPAVTFRPLPFSTPRFTMAAVWHMRNDQDPLCRWVRGLLSDLAGP